MDAQVAVAISIDLGLEWFRKWRKRPACDESKDSKLEAYRTFQPRKRTGLDYSQPNA